MNCSVILIKMLTLCSQHWNLFYFNHYLLINVTPVLGFCIKKNDENRTSSFYVLKWLYFHTNQCICETGYLINAIYTCVKIKCFKRIIPYYKTCYLVYSILLRLIWFIAANWLITMEEIIMVNNNARNYSIILNVDRKKLWWIK